MIDRAAGLVASGIPLDVAFSGSELQEAITYLNQYTMYQQCRNLGIQLDAKDIDLDTLHILHDFDSKVKSVQEKMRKRK